VIIFSYYHINIIPLELCPILLSWYMSYLHYYPGAYYTMTTYATTPVTNYYHYLQSYVIITQVLYQVRRVAPYTKGRNCTWAGYGK
jgi:hypothetical protein